MTAQDRAHHKRAALFPILKRVASILCFPETKHNTATMLTRPVTKPPLQPRTRLTGPRTTGLTAICQVHSQMTAVAKKKEIHSPIVQSPAPRTSKTNSAFCPKSTCASAPDLLVKKRKTTEAVKK